MKLTREMTAFSESIPTIEQKLRQAKVTYKQLKKNASILRKHFGRKLIQARAKARKTTVAAQEKQLKQSFGQ